MIGTNNKYPRSCQLKRGHNFVQCDNFVISLVQTGRNLCLHLCDCVFTPPRLPRPSSASSSSSSSPSPTSLPPMLMLFLIPTPFPMPHLTPKQKLTPLLLQTLKLILLQLPSPTPKLARTLKLLPTPWWTRSSVMTPPPRSPPIYPSPHCPGSTSHHPLSSGSSFPSDPYRYCQHAGL